MNVKQIIEEKNIKITTARVEMLEYLKSAEKPLCYEDMKNFISMDKATFYRNIIKFEENGIINSFESNNKRRYFELISSPHAHFICKYCDKIECIKEPIDTNLVGYVIDDIVIKGKCLECSLK
jgi:Fur family ferric uptake transcriptional regulator